MKKGVFQRKIRKTHRWMGVILGIQFFLWTIVCKIIYIFDTTVASV